MSTSNRNYEVDNFSSFLDNWGDKFDKVKNILSYLNTYPETLSTLKLTGIYDPLSIVSEQMDWVRLCSKFELAFTSSIYSQTMTKTFNTLVGMRRNLRAREIVLVVYCYSKAKTIFQAKMRLTTRN